MRDAAKQSAGSVKAKSESQTLIAANENRVAAYVSNDGEKAAYLALGSKAEANKGIRLGKESGPYKIEDYRGVISCITKEGESVITFSEV